MLTSPTDVDEIASALLKASRRQGACANGWSKAEGSTVSEPLDISDYR